MSQPRHPQGFTLIEVIAAMSIFTVIMLGLTSAFLYSFRVNATSADQTIAAYAAQAQMEMMLSNAYDTIPTGTIEPKARLSASADHYLYPFWRETVVSYVTDALSNSAAETGMKRIDVTVFWQDELSSTEKSYTLTTLSSSR